MLDPEKFAEFITATVAPFFNWPPGALDAYTKAVYPILSRAIDPQAEKVCEVVASEIREDFPRKPPPAAYARVLRELEAKQRTPSKRECHACRSTGYEAVHARRQRAGMTTTLSLPCVRCQGPRPDLPAGWERLDDREYAEACGPANPEDWIFGQALRGEFEKGTLTFEAALQVAVAEGARRFTQRFPGAATHVQSAADVVQLGTFTEKVLEPEPQPEYNP